MIDAFIFDEIFSHFFFVVGSKSTPQNMVDYLLEEEFFRRVRVF